MNLGEWATVIGGAASIISGAFVASAKIMRGVLDRHDATQRQLIDSNVGVANAISDLGKMMMVGHERTVAAVRSQLRTMEQRLLASSTRTTRDAPTKRRKARS